MRTAGKDQRAFLVHVLGAGVIGRGNRVADIGLVRLGGRREEMLALEEHRHQEAVIRRMRVAGVGVVVQEGVTLGEVGVVLGHGARLVVDAEDMDRQALGAGQQLAVARHDGAGKVAGAVDDGRSAGAQQRVGHFAHDAVDAVGDHGREHRINGGGRLLAHVRYSLCNKVNRCRRCSCRRPRRSSRSAGTRRGSLSAPRRWRGR